MKTKNIIAANLVVGMLVAGSVLVKAAAVAPNVMSDGAVGVTFPTQSGLQLPDEAAVLADSPTAPGIFVGNYVAAGVKGVGLRIRADTVPSECALYFYNQVNNREWQYPLRNLLSTNATEWKTITVPFELDAGWYLWDSGATAEKFAADLQAVTTIGIRFMRKGGATQGYEVADFMLLAGSSFTKGSNLYDFMLVNALIDSNGDDDRDGLSNWGEFLVGSDPLDQSSGFLLNIERSKIDGKVQLKWKHCEGCKFAIWRADSSGGGFKRLTPLGAEKMSTMPENCEQVEEDGTTSYFYKVEILE